ncbi:hypothetical protein ABZ540_35935 [Nocardia xishanensis]|uniref:hypothetical protein n=1 Tax=Nocardia xishanensis TaxID=238964 RepID=UPI00340EB631
MARADYDTATAWREIAALAGKSADLGREWWERYVWCVAVSIAAAEQQLDESAAWQRVRTACRQIGRRWWAPIWARAVAEAKTDRPRRHRVAKTALGEDPAHADRVAVVRAELIAAAQALPGVDPRRRHSVAAALAALAPALVARDGSMSLRELSIRSRLDLGTIRRALATAVDHQLLIRSHQYAGGSRDCDAYTLGPAVAERISAAEGTSAHTRGTPHPHGTCSPTRLRRIYQSDRRRWRLRCDVLESLAPGERLATSQHPAAKTLRSLHHQRVWWTSLTTEQQAARRAERRSVLAALHASQRAAWLAWLEERGDIVAAADRVLAHRADGGDGQVLATAPVAIHRGLHVLDWSTGGRARAPQASGAEQGVLCTV